MKKNVKKIIKYMSKCTQENTTKDEFKEYLFKFKLPDILEAYSVIKRHRNVQ